ncbi:MAG TPA: TonB family protein [Thermoanaerobaculia bacterium]|nr:TonB family protein [Thermoanaerobaculia bacterium]
MAADETTGPVPGGMLLDKVSPQAGTLFGRYRLVERAGVGGMSEVWKAEDTTLHRTVAVKVILTPIADDPAYRERFLREARLVAGLEHPNVLPVYDFGTETVEGTEVSYLVMPLVLGGSLKGQITGPMPFDVAVAWLQALGAALDHAHAKGVLHRDVKPGNVLIDSQGRPMLADFGLARSSESTSMLTQAGVALGTPRYMAPEQALGLRVDGRADQYALAVIAFEILTGTLPFQADTPALLFHQHTALPPPPASSIVSDIPPGADAVLTKALAKNPGDRFPSCLSFVEALATALGVPLAPVSGGRGRPPAPRLPLEPVSKDADVPEATTVVSGTKPAPPGRPGYLRLLLAGGILFSLALAVAVMVFLHIRRTATDSSAPPTPQPTAYSTAALPTPAPEAPPALWTPPPPLPPVTPLETLPAAAGAPKPRTPARARPTQAPEEAGPSFDAFLAAQEAQRRADAAAATATAAATPRVREGDLLDISQVDTAPSAATMVKPEVSPLARRLKVEGTVLLRVLVNEKGRSEAVEILRDTKPKVGLGQSSKEAVEKWTWTPATKDGKKVKTWTTVTVPFVAQ